MFATAIKQSLQEGYRARDLRKDCVAGITVGIVAVPLSMALAIASGAAPENGLYTAIIAGFLIALFGGSRFNITGPTAAFVVILLPITQQYGLGGLMVATIMAGLILLSMGLLKLGKLIEFVPYPVTVGFTAGIGVVIATLQLKDFFGLTIHEMPEFYLAKVQALALALPSLNIWDTLTASVTLATFLLWRKFSRKLPPHLPALIAGSLCAWIITQLVQNPDIATIGSRFSWSIEGMSGQGIPPLLPHFALPWNLPGPDGQPLGLSYGLIKDLMTAAFAIAMLGAIESLLCAVVADGMTRTRHNPNSELIGQGIGNIVAPFFGGIPATAAIARTATSIRSGSVSPVAAMVHAAFVLLSVLLLAPVLSIVPMASLAALLMMVAWNMSEAPHFIRVVRVAPRQDVAVLLTCFVLTVAFDMVIAVTVGMLLAGLLLIKRISDLTRADRVEHHVHEETVSLPDPIEIYDINGALFFGAAQRALSMIQRMDDHIRVVILDMRDVNMVDMTAIVAMENILNDLQKRNIGLVLNNLEPRIILKLRKAGIRKRKGEIAFGRNMQESCRHAMTQLQLRS